MEYRKISLEELEKLEVEAGEKVTFDKVLLVGDETVTIGAPYVEGATV